MRMTRTSASNIRSIARYREAHRDTAAFTHIAECLKCETLIVMLSPDAEQLCDEHTPKPDDEDGLGLVHRYLSTRN